MLAAIVLFAAASTTPANADIAWTFDQAAMGWSVADLNCTTYNVVGNHAVMWVASGGNPGGYIRASDPSNNCYSFTAPSVQLGNWSAYNGGTLSFSLQASHNNYADARVVLLVGAGLTIAAEISPLPATTWTNYTIPLEPASFRYNRLSGAPCTPQDFAAVLASLAAFRISAEFGSQVEETVGLDEVRIRAACYANCDESTVAPVLNVDDFTCFVNSYALAQSLPHAQQVSHYANCDGSTVAPALNVDDFTCFINRYALGCP
jgi:hypothetical protein